MDLSLKRRLLLRTFLKRIREVGLTLRLDECTFLTERVDFLSYEIDGAGVRPGKAKTQAVAKYKQPSNVQEVRQFIGFASYF